MTTRAYGRSVAGAFRRLAQALFGAGQPGDVELLDTAPGSSTADEHALLRRIAAEAVILQDQAEQVLTLARARSPLGQVAPRAGPLVHRFFRLRDRLPARCADPGDERLRATLAVILHHHALMVATALDLLAYDYRSEHVARTVESMEMGEPARLLDEVYAELSQRS